MKRPRAEGIAHSVQARLKAKAESEGRPFAELLDLYGMERFLHRLGQSRYRDHFVLKGAMLIRHWLGVATRPTRDLDLMGPPGMDGESVRAVIMDLFHVRVVDDGLQFDPASLRIEPIREASPVGGYRARFEGYLGAMAIHYQVDVGLGDKVYPPPENNLALAGLLHFPVATVRAYTPYTTVAEKLEALVTLGDANSRMKDFYDLSALAMNLSFDGPTIAEAIRVCFEQRLTAIPEGEPAGLHATFAADPLNAGRWTAFRRKSMLEDAGTDLPEVLAGIRRFALPPLQATRHSLRFQKRWPPGGPWQDGE